MLFRLISVDFLDFVSFLDGSTCVAECNEAEIFQQASLYPLFRPDLAPDQQVTFNRATAQKEALTHFVGV